MIDFLAGRPGQLLAETLLHFLWQGAALVLLLKLIEPLLRSVQDRYAASLGTLVVMLMLPFATYCALANRDVATPASMSKPTSALADVKAMDAVNSNPSDLAPVPVLARLQPVFVGLWILGVLLLAARLLVGYAATLWLRGDRQPLPTELALKVAWLGQKLGVATRCRVFLSSRIDEAIAVGCFKPLVLVPLAWATELPPSALEAVIAHELAHIRRWDLWATLLQRLAETLLFYHPAVWWLSRRLSQQRELCCDALAVSATRSPADYVLALETIARRTSAPPLTLTTSFLGGGDMNLLDRVRHVLKGEAREASAWWPAGLTALVAPLLAAVALGGWSLLPATVVADEDRESAETRAEGESDEANGYSELVVRLLEGGEEEEEDGADEGESEDAARNRKREAVRESEALRELRAVREALAREAKKLEESDEEVIVRTRNPKKRSGDDFDLSDFKPETEREARLLAVIKKLQAQVAPGSLYKVEGASGSAKKKRPPMSKDPEALSEYEEFEKIFSKKLKQDDEARQRAISEKGAAIAKRREARERQAQEEYSRALIEKDTILAKEREAKQRDAKPRKEKEGKKPMISEKDAALHKQKEAAAAVEKEAAYRKAKQLEGGDDEVESLRRALREREAQLQKAHEALQRARKDASDLDRYLKDAYRTEGDHKEDERKDKEGDARNQHPQVIDEYFRLRPKNAEQPEADKEPAERGRR